MSKKFLTGGIIVGLVIIIGFITSIILINKTPLKVNKNVSNMDYERYEEVGSNKVTVENNENKEEKVEKVEYKYLKKIDMQRLQEMLNNKEKFILVLTGTTCPHCLSYKPVLEEVLKEEKKVAYELDVWALNQEEKAKFMTIFNDISGVPTTTFFQNGEELKDKRLSGNLAKSKIKDFLENF